MKSTKYIIKKYCLNCFQHSTNKNTCDFCGLLFVNEVNSDEELRKFNREYEEKSWEKN